MQLDKKLAYKGVIQQDSSGLDWPFKMNNEFIGLIYIF